MRFVHHTYWTTAVAAAYWTAAICFICCCCCHLSAIKESRLLASAFFPPSLSPAPTADCSVVHLLDGDCCCHDEMLFLFVSPPPATSIESFLPLCFQNEYEPIEMMAAFAAFYSHCFQLLQQMIVFPLTFLDFDGKATIYGIFRHFSANVPF